MSSVQPNHELLRLFASLLSPQKTVTSGEIYNVKRAVSSAGQYRLFRPSFGSRVDAKTSKAHSDEDARFDVYGMLYLDLALQFRIRGIGAGDLSDFERRELLGSYDAAALPPPSVRAAMWAELVRANEVLTDMAPLASIGRGRSVLTADDWLKALAAFTPDRHRPQAGWQGTAAGLRKLSTSDTWIALVDESSLEKVDESSPDNSDKPAYLAPLHLALCTANVDADAASDDEPFRVSFYPSLLTALDYYSDIVRGPKQEGALGWWETLDAVEKWVASNYAETLRTHPDMRQALRGHHVARWDLARPIQPGGDSEDTPVVEGGSHGAAFALCLMQAVARAHVGSTV